MQCPTKRPLKRLTASIYEVAQVRYAAGAHTPRLIRDGTTRRHEHSEPKNIMGCGPGNGVDVDFARARSCIHAEHRGYQHVPPEQRRICLRRPQAGAVAYLVFAT